MHRVHRCVFANSFKVVIEVYCQFDENCYPCFTDEGRAIFVSMQRLNVFLAVAFGHPVNFQFKGCDIDKAGLDKRKGLKGKYQNEQQQAKPFHGRATCAWVGHFRQQEIYPVYYFLDLLVCSAIAPIVLKSPERACLYREIYINFFNVMYLYFWASRSYSFFDFSETSIYFRNCFISLWAFLWVIFVFIGEGASKHLKAFEMKDYSWYSNKAFK